MTSSAEALPAAASPAETAFPGLKKAVVHGDLPPLLSDWVNSQHAVVLPPGTTYADATRALVDTPIPTAVLTEETVEANLVSSPSDPAPVWKLGISSLPDFIRVRVLASPEPQPFLRTLWGDEVSIAGAEWLPFQLLGAAAHILFRGEAQDPAEHTRLRVCVQSLFLPLQEAETLSCMKSFHIAPGLLWKQHEFFRLCWQTR